MTRESNLDGKCLDSNGCIQMHHRSAVKVQVSTPNEPTKNGEDSRSWHYTLLYCMSFR